MGAENLGYLAALFGGMQQGKLMKQKRELTASQLEARKAEAKQKSLDRLATGEYRTNQLELQKQQLALAKAKADTEAGGVDNFLKIGAENIKSLRDLGGEYTKRVGKAGSRKAVTDLINEGRNNTRSGFAQFDTFVNNPALSKAFPGMTPKQIREMYLAGIPEYLYNENAQAPDVDFAANYNWDKANQNLLNKRKYLGTTGINDEQQWRRQEQNEYKQAIDALGGGQDAIDITVQNLGPLSGMGQQETLYYLKTGAATKDGIGRIAPNAITREQANFQRSGGMNEVPIYDEQGNITDYGLASDKANPAMLQYIQEARDYGIPEEDITRALSQMPGGKEYLNPEQTGRSAYDQLAMDQAQTEQNVDAIIDINDMVESGVGPGLSPIDPYAGAVNNLVPTGLSNAALLRPQRVEDAGKMAQLDRILKQQKIDDNKLTNPVRYQSLINKELLEQYKIKGAPIDLATKKSKETIEKFKALDIPDKLAADLDLKLAQAFQSKTGAAVAVENWKTNTDKVLKTDVGAAVGNLVKAGQTFAMAPGFGEWVGQPGNKTKYENFKAGKIGIEGLGPDAVGFADQAFAYDRARSNLERAQGDLDTWKAETLPRTKDILNALADSRFAKPKAAPAAGAGKGAAAGKGAKPAGKGTTKGGVGKASPTIQPPT